MTLEDWVEYKKQELDLFFRDKIEVHELDDEPLIYEHMDEEYWELMFNEWGYGG